MIMEIKFGCEDKDLSFGVIYEVLEHLMDENCFDEEFVVGELAGSTYKIRRVDGEWFCSKITH
jgi:hypothetical protein